MFMYLLSIFYISGMYIRHETSYKRKMRPSMCLRISFDEKWGVNEDNIYLKIKFHGSDLNISPLNFCFFK